MKKSVWHTPITLAILLRVAVIAAIVTVSVFSARYLFAEIQQSNDREVALEYFRKGVDVGFTEGSGLLGEFCSHGDLQIIYVDGYPVSVNCFLPVKILDDVRWRE